LCATLITKSITEEVFRPTIWTPQPGIYTEYKSKITKLNFVDDANSPGNLTGGISGGTGRSIEINSVGYARGSFYPFQQDDYLAAVAEWLEALDVKTPARDVDAMHRDALQFALGRGSRSGRVAWQYAKHVAGSRALRGK
jgi:hypothetical protein